MTVQDLQIEHPLVLLMPIGQKQKLPARFKDGGVEAAGARALCEKDAEPVCT
jgi:hypothetical protein